jgi:hypothetical protein
VEVCAPRAPVRGRWRTWWSSLVGGATGVVGLAPHLLHHAGPVAGTALIAGAGGTALFGALGLVASVPLLLRLRRRFGTWWAPAIALAAFAVMFSLSTFLIGPAISGGPAPKHGERVHTSSDDTGRHGTEATNPGVRPRYAARTCGGGIACVDWVSSRPR